MRPNEHMTVYTSRSLGDKYRKHIFSIFEKQLYVVRYLALYEKTTGSSIIPLSLNT
jgi:hypothetical protein